MRCQMMIRNEQRDDIDQCNEEAYLIVDASTSHSILICKGCVVRKRVHITRLSDINYKLVSFAISPPDPGPTPGGIGHKMSDVPGVALCGLKATGQLGWVQAEQVTCVNCAKG